MSSSSELVQLGSYLEDGISNEFDHETIRDDDVYYTLANHSARLLELIKDSATLPSET